MMNCSTVLVQNTWGVHLNFEGLFSSPPICPSWLTQLQQKDWHRQEIVVWDEYLRIVTHLYAGHALEHLRGIETWETIGLCISSPVYRLATNRNAGIWTLQNKIKLLPEIKQRISSTF